MGQEYDGELDFAPTLQARCKRQGEFQVSLIDRDQISLYFQLRQVGRAKGRLPAFQKGKQ